MMLLSKRATEYHYKSRSVCNLEGLMTSKSRYTVYSLTYFATLSARRHLDSEYQSFSFRICQLSSRSPAASWGFKLRLQLRLLYTSSSSEVSLEENAFAARSRVLARFALLAQIGELARRLNNMGRKNGIAASHMVEIYRWYFHDLDRRFGSFENIRRLSQ